MKDIQPAAFCVSFSWSVSGGPPFLNLPQETLADTGFHPADSSKGNLGASEISGAF